MFWTYILPGGILLAGMVDDLRSRKIHNWLILVLFAIAILSILFVQGPAGLFRALGWGFVALGLSLPLTLLKVIGGGDMKLYIVLAMVLTPQAMISCLVCSFFWGAILGVLKLILDKKTGLMYVNLLSLFKFKRLTADTLNTFPFSVSLFLGWLSSFYFIN